MGPIQTFDEFLGLLSRRRLLIAAVTVALTVLMLLYLLARPVIYEATSVIQVETPTIADGDATPPAGASAQRLQTIQQRLTTRDALLEMIDRHGLYTDLPITNDEKVHLLRMAVKFEPVASVASQGYSAPQQVSALIISARADSPDKAARIANDFAQGVLDASSEGQSSRAREAVTFYVEESRRLDAAVAATQASIADFRNANSDALPEVREARRGEIRDIEADLRTVEQSLVTLRNEKARIGQGRTLREADKQQIAALEAEENLILSQKTAQETRRAALVTALSRGPEVEQTLSAMERRLAQLQEQAAASAQRQTEAETAQKLEERKQSERFALLERAVSPEYPVSGGRKKMAVAGALASLIAGIIAAFVSDLIHPVLRTRTQFERELGLRAVVVVPELALTHRAPRKPGAAAMGFARQVAEGARQLAGRASAVLGRLPRQTVLGALVALALVLAFVAAT